MHIHLTTWIIVGALGLALMTGFVLVIQGTIQTGQDQSIILSVDNTHPKPGETIHFDIKPSRPVNPALGVTFSSPRWNLNDTVMISPYIYTLTISDRFHGYARFDARAFLGTSRWENPTISNSIIVNIDNPEEDIASIWFDTPEITLHTWDSVYIPTITTLMGTGEKKSLMDYSLIKWQIKTISGKNNGLSVSEDGWYITRSAGVYEITANIGEVKAIQKVEVSK
jgi:hypothetical protein